jgi:hypothetical protein
VELTLVITGTLTYSSAWHETNEEREWFIRKILQGEPLPLHSPLLKSPIGLLHIRSVSPIGQLTLVPTP